MLSSASTLCISSLANPCFCHLLTDSIWKQESWRVPDGFVAAAAIGADWHVRNGDFQNCDNVLWRNLAKTSGTLAVIFLRF